MVPLDPVKNPEKIVIDIKHDKIIFFNLSNFFCLIKVSAIIEQ